MNKPDDFSIPRMEKSWASRTRAYTAAMDRKMNIGSVIRWTLCQINGG